MADNSTLIELSAFSGLAGAILSQILTVNSYFGKDITQSGTGSTNEQLKSVEKFAFSSSSSIPEQPRIANIINQLGGGTFKGGKEQLIIKQPEGHSNWSQPKLGHIDLTPPHFKWRFMLGYTAYGSKTGRNGGCFLFWPGSHLKIWHYLQKHPEHYYENSTESGYTGEIDQTFRGNMEMCSADN